MSLVKRTYVDGETVITAENLNDIQDAIIENEEAIEDQGEAIEGKYTKPSGGIPSTDLASGVQTSLGKADTAYQKPSGGIPSTDLASAVQTSLGKADTALQSSDIDSTLTVAGKAADAKKTGDEISGVKNTLNHKADVIYDTASGDIASFPDGADGLPVKDLTVDIEPVQDTSGGDPSPTHICPISGWTGANVSRTGVNVWDEEWLNGFYGNSGGSFVSSQNEICSKNYISVFPGKTYYVKNYVNTTSARLYRKDKSYIGPAGLNSGEFTVPSDCYYVHINMGTAYGSTYNNDVSINYPSTDHEYHHSTGNITIPISWQSEAGTVYGGTLDVTTGAMTITYAARILDGTETWRESATVVGYHFIEQNYNPSLLLEEFRVYSDGAGYDGTPMLSHYKGVAYVSGAVLPNYSSTSFAGVNGKALGIKDTRFTTADDMKAYSLAQYNNGTPLTFVLPLVVPLSRQITSTEVETILGQNNIWSDTGAVLNCEYPADTKLYIDKKLAALVAALS